MSHYKFRLFDDFTYATGKTFSKSVTFRDKKNIPRLHISEDGVITIFKNYAWDGCSPKIRMFDWYYVGTPDGTMNKIKGKPKTYFASLVHDALYQFMSHPEMPFKRSEMDKLFFELMRQSEYSLRGLYYVAVRVFGGLYHRVMKCVRYLFRK